MGLLLLIKKLGFLFLLLSSLILYRSSAGRTSYMQVHKLAEETETDGADRHDQEETSIHERVLRANTRDYGQYSPSPKLVRPPFKLIPN